MPRGTDRYDEAARQGRLWTPQAIQPALGCWLDAGDPSTITYATGVSSWQDKSGFGRHATQATGGLQPTYQPNGPPRIAFSGQQFLNGTFDSNNAWDLLVVAKPLNSAVDRKMLFGSVADLIFLNSSDQLGVFNLSGSVFDQNGTHTWPSGQAGLLYYRTTDIVPNGDTGFARDGEAALTYENVQTGYTSTPKIGNRSGGFSQPWGDIYEMISITSSNNLSKTEPLIHKTKSEGYGAWRWTKLGAGNLVGLLPASHPFKNRPPLIGD